MSDRERLHSVKWYRTDHRGNMEEFYNYQPNRNPLAKTYKTKGIRVDVSICMALWRDARPEFAFFPRLSKPLNIDYQ